MSRRKTKIGDNSIVLDPSILLVQTGTIQGGSFQRGHWLKQTNKKNVRSALTGEIFLQNCIVSSHGFAKQNEIITAHAVLQCTSADHDSHPDFKTFFSLSQITFETSKINN